MYFKVLLPASFLFFFQAKAIYLVLVDEIYSDNSSTILCFMQEAF